MCSTTEAPGDSGSGCDISVEDGKEVPEEPKRVSLLDRLRVPTASDLKKNTRTPLWKAKVILHNKAFLVLNVRHNV